MPADTKKYQLFAFLNLASYTGLALDRLLFPIMALRGTPFWHTLAQSYSMAWHTLNEAVMMTGRSRRSIYRDMATGLVSYGVSPSGMRQLETSELIRAYGAFETMAHLGTASSESLAHLGTASSESLAHLGTADQMTKILAELQALKKEVKDLRETLLLIEHKPISKPPTSKKADAVTWADLLGEMKS